MTKRALTILIVAVLVVGGATAAIASSLGGSENSPTHVMPGGQPMNGESMHTMSDGQTMSGSEMNMDK